MRRKQEVEKSVETKYKENMQTCKKLVKDMKEECARVIVKIGILEEQL
jgi:hypothetical protein